MDLVFNGNWKFDYLYTPLEYIENTSNAYIDTGVYTGLDYTINATFSPIEFRGVYLPIIGIQYDSNKHSAFNCIWYQEKLFATDHLSEDYTEYDIRLGEIYNISIHGNEFFVNGKLLIEHERSVKALYEKIVLLFFDNGYTNNTRYGLGRLYNSTIQDSHNQLLQHLIPAMRRRDGMVGMYDQISGQFLTSPNGTKFVGGPKK